MISDLSAMITANTATFKSENTVSESLAVSHASNYLADTAQKASIAQSSASHTPNHLSAASHTHNIQPSEDAFRHVFQTKNALNHTYSAGDTNSSNYGEHWRTFSVLDVPSSALFRHIKAPYREATSRRLLSVYQNNSGRRASIGNIMRGGANFVYSGLVLFNQDPWLKAKWERLGRPVK
jgi:hypothetical protein